jgi:hypothetical protein
MAIFALFLAQNDDILSVFLRNALAERRFYPTRRAGFQLGRIPLCA